MILSCLNVLTLHPNPEYRTAYSDVILNGIELFKLSNVEHELAVDLDVPPAVAQPTSRESIKMKLVAIIGSAVGACSPNFMFLCRASNEEKQRSRP